MSNTSLLGRLRDQPISDGLRTPALAIVAALILASALLLAAASRPQGRPRTAPPATPLARAADPLPTPHARGTENLTPAAGHTARNFLVGYLGYLYGHAPAHAVRGAVRALSRSLADRRLIVPPAMRSLRPRVLALGSAPASPGLIGVRATVNDGELASYQLKLVLARAHGRLLVATVKAG